MTRFIKSIKILLKLKCDSSRLNYIKGEKCNRFKHQFMEFPYQ